MSNSSQSIRISLEIEAPVCGTAINVTGPKSHTLEQKKFFAAGATSPSPGLTPTKVSGSGATSGEICVRGSTGTANDPIYVSLDTVTFPSAPFATTDSAGNWEGLLGGVACGPYATPVSHTVRIWHQDHVTGVMAGPEVINFQAYCAAYHECEPPPTSEPIGIPVAWPEFCVVATGFQGDRKHFNGKHAVKLRQQHTNQSTVTWSNQTKTPTAIQVTLTLIRTGTPHWNLEFVAGKDHVAYHKSAANWNSVGANVLTEPSCGCGTASPSVEVHPILD